MSTAISRRRAKIMAAMRALGGEAGQREIAKAAGLTTNGVSQSLCAMAPKYVTCTDPHAKNRVWKLTDEYATGGFPLHGGLEV